MQLRPPAFDDAEAVLEVLIARDIADTGEPDYTLEDLVQEWRLAEVDLREDARVVELHGRIAGYGIVRRPGTVVAVDPRFEGRGVGRALLKWSEARGRQQGRGAHRQYVGAANVHARELLTGAGYALLRSYWRMVRELDGSEQPGHVPEGIRMRALDVETDGQAVHALDDVAFSTVPDYNPSSLEQFREEHLAAHDLDTDLSVIAETDGAMAGFALTRVWSDARVGFVDVLAVHPAHQGRGLGPALLSQAFVRYRAAGLREAQLGVATDNPRAVRLYERVGMRQKFRFDVYERATPQWPH
jgi:mycothiol synthase